MAYRLDITERLHRRMLEIVGTGLPLITRSLSDADLDGLAFLRGEMIDTIEGYCRHVHQVSGDDGQRLIEGCADVRAAYETFRLRWEHRHVSGNWLEYRLSAVVMMKQVRAHVERARALREVS